LRVWVEAGNATVTGQESAVADAGMVMAPGLPRPLRTTLFTGHDRQA
jgi:hypothetical protein